MPAYAAHVVLAISAVVGPIVAIVAVWHSRLPGRLISKTWWRMGFVAFVVALVTWCVWSLGALRLITAALPWYGWLALAVLAVWLVGVVDNHWPRYRMRNPAPEPETEPEPTPLVTS